MFGQLADSVLASVADVPRAIVRLSVLLAALVLASVVAPRAVVIDVLVVLLLVMPIPGWLAVYYLWHIYRRDDRRPRSWLLLLIAYVATLVMLFVTPIVSLAYARIADVHVEPDDAALLLGLAILVAGVTPVLMALVFAARRSGKLPPPSIG